MAARSPLSEIMSEFFLLAFLALFSGLFPCAEPSTRSDEEKGKKPGPFGNAQSGGNLARWAALAARRCAHGRRMLDANLSPGEVHDAEEFILL